MALVFLRDFRYVCVSADADVKAARLRCAVRDYVYQQREVNYEETGTPDEMPERSPGPPVEQQSSAVHQILSPSSWNPLKRCRKYLQNFSNGENAVRVFPPTYCSLDIRSRFFAIIRRWCILFSPLQKKRCVCLFGEGIQGMLLSLHRSTHTLC